LWRASVQGRATGINFRTTSPARIIPGADGYELLPTTVSLGRGSSARIAGRFGDGIMIQSRLDRVNMAILNASIPTWGLAAAHRAASISSRPIRTASRAPMRG
jgi:translocation and assembly module TamB